MAEAPRTLIANASVLDPERGTIAPDQSVLVEGERIAEVGPRLSARDARVLDVRGRTVMPGLIDCHVHLIAAGAHLGEVAEWSPMYVAAHAGQVARGMLRRGFTSVRDAGGADYGLARAIEEGLFEGPRLFFGGAALSQTGGHGDLRGPGRMAVEPGYPYSSLGNVVDGVPAMRRAVREELKRGAHHIKLMLSGGVASPTDRVDSSQFSAEEIQAAVEEAEAANRYVLGHAYTSRAIRRGLELGVRTIEHGNLMDASIPPLFLQHNAYYVPTLVTYSAMAEHGRDLGLPAVSFRKIFDVMDAGLHALELAHRAGVWIAYGSDLLGDMHRLQSREFAIRSQVQPAADVLRSATVVGARVLRMEGQLGTLAPGAFADLLVLDGNPLDDIELLARPETSVKLVMKGGRVYRDE
ncbi:MAG: amidohydrolase family protein [Chloroflexi bacterium]|nr:amidohydrolase family protein [Chloroflexota bacterium]